MTEHGLLSLDLEADSIEYHRAMEPDIMARLRDAAHKAKYKDIVVNGVKKENGEIWLKGFFQHGK